VKIRFTPAAEAQFLEAIRFVQLDNPSAANAFYDRCLDALSRLEDFPHSGRRIPEFPNLPYREVIVRPYRFFYRIHRGEIWVVAAYHGAREPEHP